MHQEPLTKELEDDLGDVVLVKKDRFSAIWFIPLIAALIGAYALYITIAHSGVPITIQFKSGEGIEAGSTKLMFKGLPVGTVGEVTVNQDLQGITVNATIHQNAASLLTENTHFWLVQPQISLSGISGLDALVSGNYIGVQAGEGPRRTNFVALETAPPIDETTPGLHVRLEADSLYSIAEGTNVYYRKIAVGVVKNFELNQKGDGVRVFLHIKEEYAKLVSKNTRFWNSSGISMKGDLTGIKLQTESMVSIITGGISFDTPTSRKPEVLAKNGDVYRLYENYEDSGLDRTSRIADPNHLHLTLQSESLASIIEGSKIYFRKIPVGEVYGYELNEQANGVDIHVRIKKQFAHLVQAQTRFWNVSGISVTGGLSGIKVRTESIGAIVAGGIAFHTPLRFEKQPPTMAVDSASGSPSATEKKSSAEQVDETVLEDGHHFKLYDDYESADVGLLSTIYFKRADGIEGGKTVIKYKGMTVGKVQSVALEQGNYAIKATVAFDPMIGKILRQGTEFWLVSPRLALTEVKGLDTLISGNYINMRVGEGAGEPTRKFYALDSSPSARHSSAGLHLVLSAKELGSINVGTTVFYRKIPVGEVQEFHINNNNDGVDIHVHIKPEYIHLLTSQSIFWNNSGFSVTGGVSGIKVNAESLLSIVAGGITFDTPTHGKRKPAQNGVRFNLYSSFDEAHEKGVKITVSFLAAKGLREGSDVRFKGVTVGKVKKVEFDQGLDHVNVTALIFPVASNLAVEGSAFWVVEPRFGLAATSDLDTLISGQYITVKAGQGPPKNEFVGLESPPKRQVVDNEEGLIISLHADRLGSIKQGLGVYYREMNVGEVLGVELGETSNSVTVTVRIASPYGLLVRSNTRFWNASGIDMSVGLFKGFSLQTNAFDTLLEGGIAFATPESDEMGDKVSSGAQFTLHDKVDPEWLKWKPAITLPNPLK